jgi:DNA-binding NarL/FixJ family response regulator
MFGDENNVLASIEAGALGYIHKDSTLDGVAETILVMCAGASPISPMIARLILERHKDSRPTVGARDKHMTMGEVDANSPVGENLLSRREQEVLNLISRGYAFGEVAGLLNVSVHTVQSHIKRLYRKLSVNSKTEAVFVATRMGLFLP